MLLPNFDSSHVFAAIFMVQIRQKVKNDFGDFVYKGRGVVSNIHYSLFTENVVRKRRREKRFLKGEVLNMGMVSES